MGKFVCVCNKDTFSSFFDLIFAGCAVPCEILTGCVANERRQNGGSSYLPIDMLFWDGEMLRLFFFCFFCSLSFLILKHIKTKNTVYLIIKVYIIGCFFA